MGDGALEVESDAVDVMPSSPSVTRWRYGRTVVGGSSIPRRGAASFVTFRTTPVLRGGGYIRGCPVLRDSGRRRVCGLLFSFHSSFLFLLELFLSSSLSITVLLSSLGSIAIPFLSLGLPTSEILHYTCN
jgi:hypothetical protein